MRSTVLSRGEESRWNGISRRSCSTGRPWTTKGRCGRGSRLWELYISPRCCLRTSETACTRTQSLNTSSAHLPPWKTTSTTNNNKLSTLPCPHSCPHYSFACAMRGRARSGDKVRVLQDAQQAPCPARAAPAHYECLKTVFLLIKSS